MKYNGGSSIKNTTNSSFNTSNNINDKLRKLNEELDQLEIAVASLTTGVSSVNTKVGTDDVAHQIEVAKTEISNAISESVETEDLSATNADITNINADTLTVDNIETTSDRIDILSNIATDDIYQRYNTIVPSEKALIIHPNSIVRISFSDKYAIVFNSSQGNSIIITNVSDKIRYFVSGSSLYINVTEEASLSCIGQTPTITNFQDTDFVFVKSGTNVLGPLYADLAQANLQNITITNTLSAKTISAENVNVSEDLTVSGIVHADIDSDNIQAEEIEVKDISADRLNSSQIHTKVEKENLGYTIIPTHQSTELYAISVPVTNGLWEIELENSLRATLNKTNSAVEITYWRSSEDSLPIIGIKNDKLFIYTRNAGKVYFSNNTLENIDTTVEIYAPTSPNYPVLEDLDEKFEIDTNNGVVNTTTTYVKDLIVTGTSIYTGKREVDVDILSVNDKIIAQGACGCHNQVLTTNEDGKTVWAYGAGFINGSCDNRVATVGAVKSYNGCYEANGNCYFPITHIGANACVHGNFVATNECGDKIQLADKKICLVNGCCNCNHIVVDNSGVDIGSRDSRLQLDYYGASLKSGSSWNNACVSVSSSEGVSIAAPIGGDESNNCIYNYATISKNGIRLESLTNCRPEGSPGPVIKGRACIITDPDGEIRIQAGICQACKSDIVIDCNGLNVTGNLAVTGDLSANTVTANCFCGKATCANDAICFNGCTYPEACIDIRNGLATQACANFIQSCVSAIESKIPAQASASNQLADKDFVNSSIATNTANFRGTYACVDELPSTGNTNNDYAFVCSLNTTTGNYIYDKYKWVASNSCWVCEYEVNTTGFTAEQLAAINSGITSNLVSKITDVYDNSVTVCMNGTCKGSFSLNQNTDSTINLGCEICNANCAVYAEHVCFTGKNDNVNYIVPFTNAANTTNTAVLYTSDLSNNAYSITFNPSTGVLCANCFCGNIDGSAEATSKVATVSNTTNATFYPAFVDSNNTTAANESVYTDADLNYNPSTNTMSIPNVKATGTVCAACGFTSDGTTSFVIEKTNELNMYLCSVGRAWLNYRGGAACTLIGNGAGTGCGTLVAATVCATNLCGNLTGCFCGCKWYDAPYTANADRKLVLSTGNACAVNDHGLPDSACCSLTFNPATGNLKVGGAVHGDSFVGNVCCVSYTPTSTDEVYFYLGKVRGGDSNGTRLTYSLNGTGIIDSGEITIINGSNANPFVEWHQSASYNGNTGVQALVITRDCTQWNCPSCYYLRVKPYAANSDFNACVRFLTDSVDKTGIGIKMPTGTPYHSILGCSLVNWSSAATCVSSSVNTTSTTSNANYYLTFVDSNNTSTTNECVYTNAGLYYNPSTHSLCNVNVAGSNYSRLGAGAADLSTTTPYINLHYNYYSGDYTTRLVDSAQGRFDITVNNGTGSTTATQTANFCFTSDGQFNAPSKVVTPKIESCNTSLSLQAGSYLMRLNCVNGLLYNPQGYCIPKVRNTATIDDNAVAGGTLDTSSLATLTCIHCYRSFIGSARAADTNTWCNVISVRYKNGFGDGCCYGVMLYQPMTTSGHWCYKQQYNGAWINEKQLIDSTGGQTITGTLTATTFCGSLNGSAKVAETLGVDASDVFACVENGNELNIYTIGTGWKDAWINCQGGVECLFIGDGTGNGDYGTLIAETVCATTTNATTTKATCVCATCCVKVCNMTVASSAAALISLTCGSHKVLLDCKYNVMIGFGACAAACYGVAIGRQASAGSDCSIAIGCLAKTSCERAIAIGQCASAGNYCGIAIGTYACTCASVDCHVVYSHGSSAHFCFSCSCSQCSVFCVLACLGIQRSPMWPLGEGCTYCGRHFVPAQWTWRNGSTSDMGNWMSWDGDENIDFIAVCGNNHCVYRTCTAALGAKLEIWANWSHDYCY